MDRFIYEFLVNPIGKLVKVEHTAEKFAHAAVWKSLTDDERNATSDIELIDKRPAPIPSPGQMDQAKRLYNAILREPKMMHAGIKEWFMRGYVEGLLKARDDDL